MAYVGGDLLEITWNHPTLGSGVIQLKASEDNTYDLGGTRSNDDDSQITGAGEKIWQLNMKGWNVSTTVPWDMNVNLDLEKINALAADPIPADWTFGHINNSVYGGKGKPVGDLVANVNNVTFPLKLAGGGKLEKKS